MADVTIKRVEDFEAIFGGGLRRARSGLGVRSFGMQVEEFPPNATQYPEHDHSADGMEEVYTALEGKAILVVGGEEYELEPGTFARVGAGRDAKADHPRRGSAGAGDRRGAGRGLRAARVHRGGPAGPDDALSSARIT